MSKRLVFYRGCWNIAWREPKDGKSVTRRESLGTVDREEAERRFLDKQKYDDIKKDTVSEIMEAYLADKAGMRSIVRAKQNWQALKIHTGHLRPDQITRDLSRQIVKKRLENVSTGTARREMAVLKAALFWHDPKSPAVIELPPPGKPRERHLTRAEYEALKAGTVLPHVRLFITLSIATAGRPSSILELTWDRVNFERGLIQLATGTEGSNKGRALVPMIGAVKDELLTAYKMRTCDHVIEYGGQRVLSVRTGVREASRRANLKGVSPGVLRHTAAVWLAEAGRSMSEIAQYMGHTSTAVTEKHYARYSPNYMKGLADILY